jgi:hypothetical protein
VLSLARPESVVLLNFARESKDLQVWQRVTLDEMLDALLDVFLGPHSRRFDAAKTNHDTICKSSGTAPSMQYESRVQARIEKAWSSGRRENR